MALHGLAAPRQFGAAVSALRAVVKYTCPGKKHNGLQQTVVFFSCENAAL